MYNPPSTPAAGIPAIAWTRRQALGGLSFGALGLGLADVLRAQSVSRPARAKSCIFIFLGGGASHVDLWDMKPDAPAEIRGEFRPIATSVPGIDLVEHLPLVAQQAHHLALVRSLEMPGVENSHPWGYYYISTGHPPDPSRYATALVDPLPSDWPCLGSVVAAKTAAPQDLPPAIQLPWIWDLMANQPYLGGFAGKLGRQFDPFLIGFDPQTTAYAKSSELFQQQPVNPARWQSVAITDLAQPEGMDAQRFEDRQALLGEVQRFERAAEQLSRARSGYDRYQEQAFSLLTSADARRAMSIEEESDEVRDRYGHSINGQCALMCRRLVEAGVPFVNFQWLAPREYYYNWDCHVENFRALREHLLPVFDRTLSTLLIDLDERGLLDETLVVIASDMGRTPRIGDALSPTGRGHWNFCQTALLAGGGIRGGQVYGASDDIAAYPRENPVRPEHIAATVYDALGIYDDLWARDAQQRPYHLLEHGTPLPLFG
jgi:hypothetical protein